MKKGQGRVLWPHILGGAWAFGPGGRGAFGLQVGAWDLLPKVGAGPPRDPPKVTYGTIIWNFSVLKNVHKLVHQIDVTKYIEKLKLCPPTVCI